MDALRAELETVIKDLVYHNLNRVIDRLRFIPSLDEIAEQYRSLQTRDSDGQTTEVCLIQLEAA